MVIALALAAAISAVQPKKYAATARVLLPPNAELAPLVTAAEARDISLTSRGGSHLVTLRHLSSSPGDAAAVVDAFVAANAKKPAQVIDRPSVSHSPVEPDLATNLLYGAAAGILAALGWMALRERRAQPAPAPVERIEPTEKHEPGNQDLCARLLKEWFADHRMLAVVGTGERQERASIAARLAVSFTELGAKTLVVDAEVNAQSVQIRPAEGFRELYVLLAPRERLTAVISEAARRFPVILIDAPAHDPEHRFASLASGALVVTKEGHEAELQTLERSLTAASVRVVGTVA